MDTTRPADADLLAIVGPEVRKALDDIDLPFYLIDLHGTLSWTNLAASALIGDRIGQPYIDCVPQDLRARVRTQFARKVVGGTATTYEIAFLDSAGLRVNFRVHSAPLRRHDQVVGVVGLAIPVHNARPGLEDGHGLTPRQAEVLRLLSEGLKTDAIAARLGVADETARNHIRALFRGLDVHSRLEAVVEGRRRGLLKSDDGV